MNAYTGIINFLQNQPTTLPHLRYTCHHCCCRQMNYNVFADTDQEAHLEALKRTNLYNKAEADNSHYAPVEKVIAKSTILCTFMAKKRIIILLRKDLKREVT